MSPNHLCSECGCPMTIGYGLAVCTEPLCRRQGVLVRGSRTAERVETRVELWHALDDRRS